MVVVQFEGGGLGNLGDEISVDGEDGEDLLSTLSLLENVDRRSCNSLIPIFYNSHRKS